MSLLAGRASFGRAFFPVAAEALCIALDYRWGGVALLNGDRKTFTLMSFHEAGHELPRAIYDLVGSPSEAVYTADAGSPHVFILDGVTERFPTQRDLCDRGVVSYRGEVFRDADGLPAGHVFAMNDRKDRDDLDSEAFFRLVSQRVGAEFNRWRTEEALRRSEDRTQEAERQLRAAIDSLPVGFALYDAEDRLVLYNALWAELYDYSDDDLHSGVVYEDLVRLDAARGAISGDPEQYIRQRLTFRRQFHGSFDMQLKDGRWITIRESGTSDGGIVGIQTDITDRMEATELLLGEKAAAEQASGAKSQFVTRISHELRTPLNAITGFAEIIRSAQFGPVGNPKYQEYAGDIVSSGQHVLDLVNSLLDLAKIESGMEDLREEIIDVAETVRAALVFVREAAAAKGVTIELMLVDDLPRLQADPRKLKQILINLLANGIKFTNSGGRVVIMVRANPNDGFVFEIADDGPGIDQPDIQNALSEFGQVDPDLSADSEGTGLGLPLAASLAALHGGVLELDSVVGFGTLVTVRLPWHRAVIVSSGRRSSL